MPSVTEPAFLSIPQPEGRRPIGGHSHLLDLDAPIQSMNQLADELGPIYKLEFAGGAELIVISSQELAAEVCDEARFDKKVGGALFNIRDFAYDGLFTAHTDEDNWQRAHQLLAPAFGMGAMPDYFPMMLEVSQQLCERWQRLNHSDEVDVADEMVRLTLEVIGLCGFDYRFDGFGREQTHPFVQAMVRALSEAMARSVRIPFLTKMAFGRNRAYEESIDYMNSVVDTVIAERKSSGRVGEVGDLLDLMLSSQADASGGLTDENIRYQIITFLIAGHETTSGLLAFTLANLLKNPTVLSRARAEVDRALGHDLDRVPTLQDISQLSYVRQVLNESLRLHPTAPAFQVMPRETTTLGGRYPVLARRPILVLAGQLHRDPSAWGENAHLFNPDNFLPARERERPPHSFKPFGNGQRACIGSQFALQEATLVIGMILQRFHLVDHNDYQLQVQETLTLKPGNFFLKVRKRSPAEHEAAQEAEAVQPLVSNDLPTLQADHATQLTVLYGSNMGAARQIAQRLTDEGEQQGYAVSFAALDEYVDALPTAGVLLVVCASYNGQPPDNAAQFHRWLSDNAENLTLADLHFAVLGVGNQDWAATYQDVPRQLDQMLASTGAQRLLERGEADARSDFFGQVDDYLPRAWAAAADQLDLRGSGPAGASDAQPKLRYRIDLLTKSGEPARFADTQTFAVIENERLAQASDAYGEAKCHLSLRLPEQTTYKTGDHLLVMGVNNSSLVERVVSRFGLQLDQEVAVLRNSPGDDVLPLGQPLSVADLLGHYVELQDPITQRQLKLLANYVRCPVRLAEIESLASDAQRFQTEVAAKHLSLLQFLEQAPECELPFAAFLELVSPMRPRYYSISSSALCEPRSIDLTISALRAKHLASDEAAPQFYEGACSNYLAQLAPGDLLTGRVRAVDSHFLPPTDLSTPMIMVGPGTGVAPFRGFIQDRLWHKQEGKALGPAALFFGCRHPQADFLYQEEFERAHEAGLVELAVAFSRCAADELTPSADYLQVAGYVQDAITSRADRVWSMLNDGGIVYVCGDAANMLPDVKACFRALYLANTPDADEAAATEWLATLERDARFLVDAWA